MKIKKVSAIAVGLSLVLGLAACGGGGATATDAPTSTPAPTVAPATQAPATEAPVATQAPVVEEPLQTQAPAPEFSGADFSNGNFSFLRLDHSRKATSPDLELALDSFEGQPAVRISPVGGKLPWVGVSASSLLGNDVSKAKYLVLKLGLKSLDGTFWPMTGKVYTFTGDDLTETEAKSKFGVQTPESNPKLVYVELPKTLEAGKHNYVMFQPSQDDGSGYAGKNDIYVMGVGFMDADRNYLAVDANAEEDFPEGYDVAAVDEGRHYQYALPEMDWAAGGWVNFNGGDGANGVPLSVWKEARQLVIEYAPHEDGTSPIDDNPDGWKFVVQIKNDTLNNDWQEITGADLRVERVEGAKLILTLEGMESVVEVQNVGLGIWDGGDAVTKAYLECVEGPKEYELTADFAAGGWINFNSDVVPLEVWQGASKFVIEYAPREDGSSPLDENPDAGKFVVQVVSDTSNNDWNEIALNDLLVERVEGKSLTLTLENMANVESVANIGYGAWDGGDTITGMYLITSWQPVTEPEAE